ncbi:MAG TPA: antibiotic biosynthesis monooxygenase [Phaeodactylibacter sp.]|nr:antibiotic biosynthesis monooxygenase [Phaeodactylibacter sp.]
MIKRIVRLTFHHDKTEDFLLIFQNNKEKIAAFQGCTHLELWRDTKQSYVFFTYSYWESEAALNAYRHSELFQKVWAKTKVLFSEKPQAWSVELLYNSSQPHDMKSKE